jgi:hypothetical protein
MSYADASELAKNPWVIRSKADIISLWERMDNYLYVPSNLVDSKKYPIQNKTA